MAKDAVCFANASGGKILIGIEDNEDEPATGQTITDKTLPEKIVKAINHRTINTGIEVPYSTKPQSLYCLRTIL